MSDAGSCSEGLRTLVVVNPASGQDEAVLATLNRAFRDLDVDWDVILTHDAGDARRGAERAVESGCDVVGVYGGDGTVSEAALALVGGSTPLAILPGGTGNIVAQELGVPLDLEQAVRSLYGGERRVRSLDALVCGDRLSLLRIGLGADAGVMKRATREQKDRLGWLAYLVAALEEVQEREPQSLEFELDGRAFEVEAVAAVAANIGRLGRTGANFPGEVDPFDGQLDFFIVHRADPAAVLELGVRMLGPGGEAAAVDDPGAAGAVLSHAAGRRLHVRSADWPAHGDGDLLGETPLEIEVRPGAVPVVVPDEPDEPDEPDRAGQESA